MSAGAVVLGVPAALGGLTMPTKMDAIWLVLTVACTLPFVMWIQSLKYVSAFSTLLALNLEPVYAILLAALLFQEYDELTPLFYGGTAIILLAVLLQPQLRHSLISGRRDDVSRQRQRLHKTFIRDMSNSVLLFYENLVD